MSKQVIEVLNQSGLSAGLAKSLKENFTPFLEQANEWKAKAKLLVITSEDQVEEMQEARVARLALKNIRGGVEKKRVELKEDIVREGRAIDGVANVIKALVVPIEKHLEEQENFIKIQEQKKRAELKESREGELVKYDVNVSYLDLANMPEDIFETLLTLSRRDFQMRKESEERMRIDAEKRAEEERVKRAENEAKRKEEQAELDRLRADKERLEKLNRQKQEKIRKSKEAERKRLESVRLAAEKTERDRLLEIKRVEEERIAEGQRIAQASDIEKVQMLMDQIKSISIPNVKSEKAQVEFRMVAKSLNQIENRLIILTNKL